MIDIKLNCADNYLDARLTKLNNVIAVMKTVINSSAFATTILNFEFEGQKTFFYRKNIWGRYIDHVYNNQQVLSLILLAKEEVGNQKEGQIDLYLELIMGASGSVIGFGRPEEKEIYTYAEMFDTMTIPELVNHYVHEWAHKIGFDHAFTRNRKRNYSVPYGVGDIAEKIAEKYI